MLQELKDKLIYEISLLKQYFSVNDYNDIVKLIGNLEYNESDKKDKFLIKKYFDDNINLIYTIIKKTKTKPNIQYDEFVNIIVSFNNLNELITEIIEKLFNLNVSYTSYKNAINLKGKNRRYLIQKPLIKDETLDYEKYSKDNIIVIKSLTKDTSKNPGILHKLLCNDKIKQSVICLSNESIIELYETLGLYIKHQKQNNLKQ